MSETTCSWCEYFDGGGLNQVLRAREADAALEGDCLCPQSPRFQTTSKMTCEAFVLDEQWRRREGAVEPVGVVSWVEGRR